MQKVNDLIFDILVSKQGVVLPSIGTLNVDCRPAKMSGKNIIQAPVYTVVYYGEIDNGVYPISDSIMNEYGIDHAAAEVIYNEWLRSACREERIIIENVGEIRGCVFTASPLLDSKLNPTSEGSYRMNPVRSCKWIWITLAVIAAILLLCWVLRRECGSCRGKVPAQTQSVDVPATANASAVDGATVVPAAPAMEVDSRPVVSSSVASDRYYVVAGVFVEEANADKAGDAARKIEPGVQIQKLPYKGKTMLTIYSTDNEQDAVRNMRRLRKVEDAVWVYHHKP